MVLEFVLWAISRPLIALFSLFPAFQLPVQVTSSAASLGSWLGSGLGRFKHVLPTGAIVAGAHVLVTAFVIAVGVWAVLWVWSKLPVVGK